MQERVPLPNANPSAYLPTNVLQLQPPQRDEEDQSEYQSQLVRHIAASAPNQLPYRASKPSLNHTEDPADNADEESDQRSKTIGKSRRVVPGVKVIVVAAALTEQVMLTPKDDEK